MTFSTRAACANSRTDLPQSLTQGEQWPPRILAPLSCPAVMVAVEGEMAASADGEQVARPVVARLAVAMMRL